MTKGMASKDIAYDEIMIMELVKVMRWAIAKRQTISMKLTIAINPSRLLPGGEYHLGLEYRDSMAYRCQCMAWPSVRIFADACAGR